LETRLQSAFFIAGERRGSKPETTMLPPQPAGNTWQGTALARLLAMVKKFSATAIR
jgi:hypothetical protein